MRTAAAQMGDTGMLRPLRRKDVETGRREERKRIIAWLRGFATERTDQLARYIETEEHWK